MRALLERILHIPLLPSERSKSIHAQWPYELLVAVGQLTRYALRCWQSQSIRRSSPQACYERKQKGYSKTHDAVVTCLTSASSALFSSVF